jgi:glutamate receptor, ionotropic, invertebrate
MIFILFPSSLLMWVFDRYSPYSYQNNREKYKEDEEKREFTLKECLWFCMTSLTPQGGGKFFSFQLISTSIRYSS